MNRAGDFSLARFFLRIRVQRLESIGAAYKWRIRQFSSHAFLVCFFCEGHCADQAGSKGHYTIDKLRLCQGIREKGAGQQSQKHHRAHSGGQSQGTSVFLQDVWQNTLILLFLKPPVQGSLPNYLPSFFKLKSFFFIGAPHCDAPGKPQRFPLDRMIKNFYVPISAKSEGSICGS